MRGEINNTSTTMSKSSDLENVAFGGNAVLFKPGLMPEEMKAGYDTWSETYDEAMHAVTQYRCLAITLEEVLQRVSPERRPNIRVLDVGAGTGRVGQDLYREGFRHIDAVDPSEGMMRKLRERGIYTNDFVEFIGVGQSSVPKDTYDLLIISGSMGEGHIPVRGLDDLVCAAKNGGLVVIVMRLESLQTVAAYKDKLEPHMDKLEKEGKWRKVERRVVPNYFYHQEGVVYVYSVTKG